jgi:hypothetical protein
MSEQESDLMEGYERAHSNSKLGWDVRMQGSTVRNIIKHVQEMKEKGKVASVFLRFKNTYKEQKCWNIRNRAPFSCIESGLQTQSIPHSRAVIQTKTLIW